MSDNARFILIMVAITALAVWYGATHPQNAVERETTPSFGHVETLTYNGHEYLVFNNSGIVHNPDCKCMKKGE